MPVKTYTLIGADGVPYPSPTPGKLGGHSRTKGVRTARLPGRAEPAAARLRAALPRVLRRRGDRDRGGLPAVRGVHACGVSGVEGRGGAECPSLPCRPQEGGPSPSRGRARSRRGRVRARGVGRRRPTRAAGPAGDRRRPRARCGSRRRPLARAVGAVERLSACASRSASSSCCASRARPRPTMSAEACARGRAAGAILFRDNIAGGGELRALTRQLRGRRAGPPVTPIVCTDQEGGEIRNVGWVPPAGPARRADARPVTRGRARGLATARAST